ncbi:hypothetical protein IU487_33760 [Nocardia puris]|uniref:hypothetical protein n=1 Tax=Nocardia puris TaxID=208602 RepID=UPI0018944A78|nr:hypothetical protein [Nocardia puris]MBF6215968.1 hypothetical protein [Nocardia puris]
MLVKESKRLIYPEHDTPPAAGCGALEHTVIVTSNPDGTISGPHRPRQWLPATIDQPVTAAEKAALAELPALSNDAKRLLGAIICRIGTSDPNR